MYDFYTNGGTYWIAEKRTNCPINEIIDTESECIVAAAQQSLQYKNVESQGGLPAGCFTWLKGSSKQVYFNNITEITPISLDYYRTSGLCKTGNTICPCLLFYFS